MFKKIAVCKPLLIAWLVGCSILVLAQSPQPRLGRIATREEIQTADITVLPNGVGLPVGGGTAREGRQIYDRQCARCHGAQGNGTQGYPPLTGGQGTLKSDKPMLTVGSYWPYATNIWDYTRRAMPYDNPGVLTTDEIYSVTAYILRMNNLVTDADLLDQHSLPKIQMPNKNGFVPDPRPDVKARRR